MKQLLISSILILSFASAAFSATPACSIKDMPVKFEGQAGDLFTRVPVIFTLDKVLKISRPDGNTGSRASYDVQAQINLGGRTIGIKAIELSCYGAEGLRELILKTDDELVIALLATLRYDEATNTYTLAEVIKDGARRFVLKAQGQLGN